MTLRVQNLRSDLPFLEIDALDFRPGEIYILLGPNGAGKTSLLRGLAGLIETTFDTLEINGKAAEDLSRAEWAAQIGYCPQHLFAHPDLNVERFLSSTRLSTASAQKKALEDAHQLLKGEELGHLAKRSLSTLSGGEWQRIILLSLEMRNAPLWFLDEPTNHLDPRSQIATLNYLATQVATTKRTVVLTSHELSLLGLLHRPGDYPPPTVICLRDGKIQSTLPLDDENLSTHLSALFRISVCSARDEEGRTFLYPGRGEAHD